MIRHWCYMPEVDRLIILAFALGLAQVPIQAHGKLPTSNNLSKQRIVSGDMWRWKFGALLESAHETWAGHGWCKEGPQMAFCRVSMANLMITCQKDVWLGAKTIGKPCVWKPHARFEAAGVESIPVGTAPPLDPTHNGKYTWELIQTKGKDKIWLNI